MPSTQDLRFITTLYANTLDARSQKVFDQVHKNIPLTWYLMFSPRSRGTDMGMGKGVVPYRGGGKFRVTIGNAQNPNHKWYDTYEGLAVSTSEEQTDAFEVMRNSSATVGISGPEVDDNRGEFAVRNLLREKVNTMEMTVKEKHEEALVRGRVGVTGPSPTLRMEAVPKGPNPLGYLIQKDPTIAGVKIHELDQGTETAFRNQVRSSTAAGAGSFLAFFRDMNRVYMATAMFSNTTRPDFGLCDSFVYQALEAAMFEKQRFGPFTSTPAQESAGFPSVMFKEMELFASDFVPNLGNTLGDTTSVVQSDTQGVVFFLNSTALKLYLSDRRRMATSAFIEPYDQDAIYGKMLTRLQLVTTERRKLGVLFGIDSINLAP